MGEPIEIKRLEKGNHIKEDITWLKNEKAEAWYEQKKDAGYSESHNKAENHWQSAPWPWESGKPWTNLTNTESTKPQANLTKTEE